MVNRKALETLEYTKVRARLTENKNISINLMI